MVKDITITGIDKAGISQPKNDGTRGSGLYKVPFKLSERPPTGWDRFLVNAWNHPESWTTLHRPGIARVYGDTIVLDGTTVEEVEKAHKAVLEAAVARANREYIAHTEEQARLAGEKANAEAVHRRHVEDAADRIKFGE